MNKTKIPWCDWTWNPFTGCSAVSEGCVNCYARELSTRFSWPWGEATWHPKRLFELGQAKAGDLIFVCSMGDFFHHTAHDAWRDSVMHEIIEHPELTFLILTKRAELMREYFVRFRAPDMYVTQGYDMPQNLWLGVTAENQTRANERIPVLLSIPDVAVTFASVEPMLGPVDLRGFMPRLDWVIAGPENGPKARNFDPWWIEKLCGEVVCAGSKFFDKREIPDVVREFPGHAAYDNCCHAENGRCRHPENTQFRDCVECPLFQKLSDEEYGASADDELGG